MTDPSLVAVLIGFAGGALSTAAISAFITHWVFHPVISVCLDKKKGSYGDVKVNDFDKEGNLTGSHPAKFFRLHIENAGLSSIKDCCGYITKITKHTDQGQDAPHQESLNLGG
jgi:hypothetical protein